MKINCDMFLNSDMLHENKQLRFNSGETIWFDYSSWSDSETQYDNEYTTR